MGRSRRIYFQMLLLQRQILLGVKKKLAAVEGSGYYHPPPPPVQKFMADIYVGLLILFLHRNPSATGFVSALACEKMNTEQPVKIIKLVARKC